MRRLIPKRRTLISVLVSLSTAACARTGELALRSSPAPRLNPSQRVTVLVRGDTITVRHVQIRADTLFGNRFQGDAACDGCPVAIPLTEITSATVERSDVGAMAITFVPIVALIVVLSAADIGGD